MFADTEILPVAIADRQERLDGFGIYIVVQKCLYH